MKAAARRAGNVFASAGGAFATVALMVALQAHVPVWFLSVLLVAPGAVTAAFIPGAWRRWYRWAAIYGLTQITYPWATAPLVVVALTWALHRSWVVEREGSAAHLRAVKIPARAQRRSLRDRLAHQHGGAA